MGEAAGGEMVGEMGEVPFMFVAGVNIGPLLVRRAAYLQAGGFDEAFSPRSHLYLTCISLHLACISHESRSTSSRSISTARSRTRALSRTSA